MLSALVFLGLLSPALAQQIGNPYGSEFTSPLPNCPLSVYSKDDPESLQQSLSDCKVVVPNIKAGQLPVTAYHLRTDVLPTQGFSESGIGKIVTDDNFKVLKGVTSFLIEIFEDCMRLPHWHTSVELGYMVSGTIEVYLWRSPGEISIFTVNGGSLWVIPQGALHSLNNIGDGSAVMAIGFSNPKPGDFDLPTIYDGVPAPIRNAYTSPHTRLREYKGPTINPLFGRESIATKLRQRRDEPSPYRFNIDHVKPLFDDEKLGSVIWAVRDNWPILAECGLRGIGSKIAFVRTILQPDTSRDCIWWPDSNALYVVIRGSANFTLILPGHDPTPLLVKSNDMIFVPVGIAHAIVNVDPLETFEVVTFLDNDKPLPEISLAVATDFFPRSIVDESLTEWGNRDNGSLTMSRPLKHLNKFRYTPYLLPADKF